MATTTPIATAENASKHPQQVHITEAGGAEHQQTIYNVDIEAEETATKNGCVTPTAVKEVIDEVEQHTQIKTNNIAPSSDTGPAEAGETPATPAAATFSVMVVNDAPETRLCGKKLLLCRRFKDCGGILRNFNSLPLFVYATSPSTHAISADGVGVAKEAVAAADVLGQKVSEY